MCCLNFHSICRDTVALFFVLITTTSAASQEVWTFEEHVSPFLSKYCTSCHGQEEMESGIRVDQLDGELRGRRQFPWKAIDKHVGEESMPPEGEPQPTADERKALALWIDGAIQKSLLRDKERNGSAVDNTIVLLGSGVSTTHNPRNLSTMLAGGANMGLKHGTYWRQENSHMSKLFLSILHSMGIHQESFADSTGTLTDSIFLDA